MMRTLMAIAVAVGALFGAAVPVLAETETTDPDGAYQRVEVSMADLALEVPADWDVRTKMDHFTLYLFDDEYDDVPWPLAWHVLEMRWQAREGSCELSMYPDAPLTLSAHAEQLSHQGSQEAGRAWEPSVATSLRLPIGEAARTGYSFTSTDYGRVAYVFESDGMRYSFSCTANSRDVDVWRRIAESIEPLGDPIVARHQVIGFKSVVPVVDTSLTGSLEDSLVVVGCWVAWWIEHSDGTFEERLACDILDDMVDPPRFQASPPIERVMVSGAACEWASDFWRVTDDSDVYASSFEITVTPTGTVFASFIYPAVALDCTDE